MEFLTHFEPIGDQTFGGPMRVKSAESVQSVVVKEMVAFIRTKKSHPVLRGWDFIKKAYEKVA